MASEPPEPDEPDEPIIGTYIYRSDQGITLGAIYPSDAFRGAQERIEASRLPPIRLREGAGVVGCTYYGDVVERRGRMINGLPEALWRWYSTAAGGFFAWRWAVRDGRPECWHGR